MTESKEVIVYHKDDCHLCDAMLEQLHVLEQQQKPRKFHLNLRNIEDNDQWFSQFREYVPVIVVNDEEVCHYFLNQEEFNTALMQA
jgi:glutaredoxin